LRKGEKVWTVKDCKGDYYFKLFLEKDGYVLGYCTNWSTPREAVLKFKDFVGDCVDLNAECLARALPTLLVALLTILALQEEARATCAGAGSITMLQPQLVKSAR
jgi:hypothetical protein